MTISDYLFHLERTLDKNPPGDGDGWASERRCVLRQALRSVYRDAYEAGLADGLRDAADARIAAEEWRKRQEQDDA